MAAAVEHNARPPKVADELAWELLRDEWELLLAIGTGPTDAVTAARRVGEEPSALDGRLALLVQHGLLKSIDGGYSLVSAYHQRQEGMASYLRDLVLKRIELGGLPPVVARVRYDVGDCPDLARLLQQADMGLFPAVTDMASRPESDRSERFLVIFAVSASCPPPEPDTLDNAGVPTSGDLVPQVLRAIRSAAIERSRSETAATAKLWVAEMRVDPEIADDIIDAMEDFLLEAPAVSGRGASAFAVWPVRSNASPAQAGGE